MRKQRNKDGLTRQKQVELLQVKQPFDALEEDFSNLFSRMLHTAALVRYYSPTGPDGSFASLYMYEPLVILNEIKQYDTLSAEQEFIQLGQASLEDRRVGKNRLKEQLFNQVFNWHQRLNHSMLLTETSSLQAEVNTYQRMLMKLPLSDGRSTQRVFYFLLRYIRHLQKQYPDYLEELMQSGTNDPSLSVWVATILNYQHIVRSFNNRWKDYASFYLEKIMGAQTQGAVLPHAWFIVRKNKETDCSILPAYTRFTATVASDMPPVCYRNEEAYFLNNMQLSKVYSLSLEKDTEKYPASRLAYITSVLQKDLSEAIEILPDDDTEKTPRPLFNAQETQAKSTHAASRFLSTGFLIESSLLVLREGVRNVSLVFHLTHESSLYFQTLVDRILETAGEDESHTYTHPDMVKYKILSDAFYLEISTETGWNRIEDYSLSLQDGEQSLELEFHLDENFPAAVSCSEPHGYLTRHPALRILMNQDAWLFPYSWALRLSVSKLTLTTSVSGISSLEVHNELGQIDPSTPFPPFGPQPEKGAWLAIGNYEIASKPVYCLNLYFRWQQLPTNECGFYDRYRRYPFPIDNASFKVRLEQLADKRWAAIAGSQSFLFATDDSSPAPSPRESLSAYSSISCPITENHQTFKSGEERYRYGLSRNGFYRLILDEPEIGFGHALYRQLFADIMMQNSFRRKKVTPPDLPVTPMLDGIEAGYTAKEEYSFTGGKGNTDLHFYYINPLQENTLALADTTRPIPLVKAPEEEGNLLFAFRHAEGNNQIRLLIEMASLKREVEVEDLPLVQWSYFNGNHWTRLKPEAIRTDDTSHFLCSGLIEIDLPQAVCPEWMDKNGEFWLAAGFKRNTRNCSSLLSLYLNPVRALLDMEEELTKELFEGISRFTGKFEFEKTPAELTDIYQVLPCKGGKAQETKEDMKVRTIQRICHRNRAVLPSDYEQMILSEFPEVEKVLCLPGLDSKGQRRKAIVTLAVMQKETDKKKLPLCEHGLLVEIENYVGRHASPFVIVDAITPVYERVTVRGWLEVDPGKQTGLVIRETEERIDRCIAPWMQKEELPVFGHSFSSADLYNTIREDPTILKLNYLSVLHVTLNGTKGERDYFLNRYYNSSQPDFIISPSAPWCILIPEDKHLLSVEKPEARLWEPGLGDLRIGGTFIINK